MKTIQAGAAFCFSLFAFIFLISSPAAAEGATSYTEPYHRSFMPFSSPSPYKMEHYNRKGSSITLNYGVEDNLPPIVVGHGKVHLDCSAKSTDGGWDVSIEPGSVCWNTFTLPCFYEAGVKRCGVVVPSHAIQPSDVEIFPVSLCDAAHRGTPASKEYCVFGSNVVGNTGDDMFAIKSGASAYLEYMKRGGIGTYNRLKYIERSADAAPPLMLPSGPLSGGAFADYDAFLSSPPAVTGVDVSADDACYAVDVKICEEVSVSGVPPFDGQCGPAAGMTGTTFNHYFDTAEAVPEDLRCTYGATAEVVDKGTYFSWFCDGLNGGHASPECVAGKVAGGVCGAAEGQTFSSKADIPAEDLCAAGTASAIAGSGPWSWTCASPSTAPVACSAQAPPNECLSDIGDVIYVLDDSNSMKNKGKLDRAQSVMDESLAKLVEKKSRQAPDDTKMCVTGMQERAFVTYTVVPPKCDEARAYAKKDCGRPVEVGGNEVARSEADKNGLCANFWAGEFHSAADGPAEKAAILSKGHDSIYSFTDTELSTPLYRRVLQAASYVGSGVPGKPNKIIVVTDGNDVGWETDEDALNGLKGYHDLRVYILQVVKKTGDVDKDPKKKVVAITSATGGFFARVYTEDNAGFQALMNLAVTGCER